VGTIDYRKSKLFIPILICLFNFGCAQNAADEDWPELENPTIIDEVHHQDLMNLSDLELPQPVDRAYDNPATEDRRERVAVTQPRQKPQELVVPKLDPPEKKEDPKSEEPKLEQPKAEEPKKEKKENKPVAKEGRGSVYYIPVITQVRRCDEKAQVHMRDLSGQVLALLCKNEIADCAMQGSCYYSNGKDIKLFAYRKLVEIKDPQTGRKFSEPRFVINNEHARCPHGMGFRRICLDPYRSVAADMKFHKAGDVFYIPVLKGQILPNGEVHDGYVVVRDIGGAILGEGRFDFFIGFDSYVGHVFSKLNLSNPNRSTFSYYKVPEDRAEEVRKLRAYPMVPSKVHNQALAALGLDPKSGVAKAAMSQFDIASTFYRSKFIVD
jgi:3D (Asp-Asp-Asp) domain-containing protein